MRAYVWAGLYRERAGDRDGTGTEHKQGRKRQSVEKAREVFVCVEGRTGGRKDGRCERYR